MPAKKKGSIKLCAIPPKEFHKEFRSGTLLHNLGRIRVACWLMLLGMVVYTATDLHTLYNSPDSAGLDLLPGLAWLRIGLAVSAVAALVLVGKPASEKDLRPRHANLDFFCPLYFTCYVACISAMAFPLRGELNPYLIFILVCSSFITQPVPRAVAVLLAALASLTLFLHLFDVDWAACKYDYVGAVVLTLVCAVIARVSCKARVGQFTQQKLIEQRNEELREARTAAEAANRAKAEFLASMSHEIRTPMNAILGLTEITLDSQLGEQQRKWLGTAREAAAHLMSIMEGILDYSRIESNALALEAVSFDLHTTVDGVVRNMAPSASAKGLELSHRIAPDAPRSLRGDPMRVRQILVNLLGNAIKFSDRGEVSLEVASSPSASPDSVCMTFTVRDQGIGIPEDRQEAVFDRFLQLDGSSTRKFGGTGLGLATSRKLARLMNGDITVESEPGRGSAFTFAACFLRDESDATPPTSARDQEPCSALVVSPDPGQANGLAQLLRQEGFEPRTVGSVPLALDATAADPADIVILDEPPLHSEIIGAVSALRLQHPRLAILVCADLLPEPEQRALLRAGTDELLTKPLHPERLCTAVYRVLAEKRGHPAEDACVDHALAMRHLGLDEATYREFLPTATKVLKAEMGKARQAFADDDLPVLARAAHSVKTSAGALGASRLHQAADSLERAWRSGDGDAARRLYESLMRELERTLEGLVEETGSD